MPYLAVACLTLAVGFMGFSSGAGYYGKNKDSKCLIET